MLKYCENRAGGERRRRASVPPGYGQTRSRRFTMAAYTRETVGWPCAGGGEALEAIAAAGGRPRPVKEGWHIDETTTVVCRLGRLWVSCPRASERPRRSNFGP